VLRRRPETEQSAQFVAPPAGPRFFAHSACCRAIAKLYELAGIRHGDQSEKREFTANSRSNEPNSVAEIADAVEMSPASVVRYHTLSHLIPPLAEMLGARKRP
jgi:hypothetical protein